MEYGGDNGKHYREPEFHHNLFSYWNQFQWVLRNCISHRFCRIIDCCNSDCLTSINLCRRIKYTHGQWRNFVSVEYGADNSKHCGEPDFNDNLFCNWYQFKWLLRNCIGNS